MRKYYSVLYGPTYKKRETPILEPAVVTGRGSVAVGGVRAPVLFLAYYNDRGSFRRAMEVTWFGKPVAKVSHAYAGGKGYYQIPGSTATNQRIAQAENLTYWSEAVWFPSVLVRDKRVRWEAIDDVTARLIVPFGDDEDTLLVKFDSHTGLITRMSAQRYRSAEAQEKSAWQVDYLNWQSIHEVMVPTELQVKWGDQSSPAEILTTENIEYNVQAFLSSHREFLQVLISR